MTKKIVEYKHGMTQRPGMLIRKGTQIFRVVKHAGGLFPNQGLDWLRVDG